MSVKRFVLGGVALASLVLIGCGTGNTVTAPKTVRVVAKEWAFELSRASIPAGKVSFELVNQGRVSHEMVVVKSDLPAKGLSPRADARNIMDTAAAGQVFGEVENVQVGQAKTEMLDLTPGRYLLICNQVGHYKAGMVTEFAVTP